MLVNTRQGCVASQHTSHHTQHFTQAARSHVLARLVAASILLLLALEQLSHSSPMISKTHLPQKGDEMEHVCRIEEKKRSPNYVQLGYETEVHDFL